MTEAELVHLRKEILLLGELQMKYKEKLQRIPSSMAEKQEALLVQAFEEQIASMEGTVVTKSAELEAVRAKMGDLEQAVAKKDATIAELNRMMKRVHDENRENLEAVEAANAALVQTQIQLETQVDHLKAQATIAPVRRAGFGGPASSAAAAAPSRFGATTSASVDIHHHRRDATSAAAAAAAAAAGKTSSTLDSGDEKPFVVGSPPLSSGSESSEVQRMRMLSAGGGGGRRLVNLERRMDGVDLDESMDSLRARSPEIGSAVSAREHHLGTSDSSSVNGNRH